MRIDLVLLGLLITIKPVLSYIALTDFLILLTLKNQPNLICFKYLNIVVKSYVINPNFLIVLLLGVIKMDEKKVLKPIDEMLVDPW